MLNVSLDCKTHFIRSDNKLKVKFWLSKINRCLTFGRINVDKKYQPRFYISRYIGQST